MIKYQEPKIHAGHIEVACAELIGYRKNTIVPNVFWGLGLAHEADLLVLDKSGRFTEVEIKVTLSDLKNDFKKWHGHKSKLISRLQYAVPEKLVDAAFGLIPSNAGLISVRWNGNLNKFQASYERIGTHDKLTAKPASETVMKFMSLGCMRIWSLKEKNNKTRLIPV